MGVVMRVWLYRHKLSLVLVVVQHPIDGRGIERRSACELAEAFKEHAGFVEGRDWNETFLLPEREILLAASWGDMYDSGTFSFAHRIPRDHPMNLACGLRRSPLLFHRNIGNFRWKASWITLCLEFVERSVIWPSQHFGSSQFTQDFIT